MRPFGEYSMVDVDASGGLQVIVKELSDAGFLDGSAMTCTGETLAEQVARLAPPAPDHEVIYSVEKPFKDTGGLRLLRGNLAPDGGRSSSWPASRAAWRTESSPGGHGCSTVSETSSTRSTITPTRSATTTWW